jgi:hypothetical protein
MKTALFALRTIAKKTIQKQRHKGAAFFFCALVWSAYLLHKQFQNLRFRSSTQKTIHR